MGVRSLGFATDLAARRAGGSSVVDAGDHVVARSVDNPTYWWGNFVLVRGPEDVERGLRISRREFPAAGHVAIGTDGTGGGGRLT